MGLNLVLVVVGVIVFFIIAFLIMLSRWYKKASQGQALVKTGVGGTTVSFSGMTVIPIAHKMEMMNISLRTIIISREGKDGLICKDNMRADIRVTFFVRVNKTKEDVIQVAQSVGCARASNIEALNNLFDSKFSEALKTVGKKFDFVDLYNKRDEFRQEIINIIGTDLNGYILDDAAIDHLEQTPITLLDEYNILDAEGIKKIIDITSKEKVQSNLIERDKEKKIKRQDVEAREAILELERQLTEKEEKQEREIANIKAREQAEIEKVNEEERLKSEKARIAVEEEIQIAEENRLREVLVAEKSKERTDAVETERVEKDKLLEQTEKERIVTLAQIEKEKAVEEEKKNIQEVIRERVAIEKTVVEEEESIKDTKAESLAEREKLVAIKKAEETAEADLVQQIKMAEAAKQASEFKAEQVLIDAKADQEAAVKKAEAIKTLADADASKQAASGIAEAQIMEAKAIAREREGDAEAKVIEATSLAEAKGLEAKAAAREKEGEAEASVIQAAHLAEAKGLEARAEGERKIGLADAEVTREKAEAMKQLDGVGKEHEEFKLRLEKEKEIELAQINIQTEIAQAQANVLGEALKSAKIDIVGGESEFFDRITNAITQGKSIERVVQNSNTIMEVKDQLLAATEGVEGDSFPEKISGMIRKFGVSSEDLKNLSVSALVVKLMQETQNEEEQSMLGKLLGMAKMAGLENVTPSSLGIKA